MFSIQILYDGLIALGIVIAIAVVFSAAIIAAGASYKRQQARLARAAQVIATRPQHESDRAGELVLR
jgi:hypothetical protein